MSCIVGVTRNAATELSKKFGFSSTDKGAQLIVQELVSEKLAEFICLISNEVKDIDIESRAVEFLTENLV